LDLTKEAVLSCANKIAQLNVVGVEGALISHFYSPVYWTSITIGRDKKRGA